MATRTIFLAISRQSPRQRAHFAVFVPSELDSGKGTLIHVVGAPMAGYMLEFKHNYHPESEEPPRTMVAIGEVHADNIAGTDDTVESIDSIPKNSVEKVATQLPPPRISQNFMQPVNDTTNRRCQEWTIDYIRRLADLGYIRPDAIQIVQSQRDPPSHGIGLRAIAQG